MIKNTTLIFCLLVLSIGMVSAQNSTPNDTIVYKQTKQGDLTLHVFYPENYSNTDNRSAIVSFLEVVGLVDVGRQKHFSKLLGNTSKKTDMEIVENFKKNFKRKLSIS